MAKDCLHCGLQFSDTTNFCPTCGRPTESGFRIRPMQESELDRLHREIKEKDDLIRQLVLTRPMRGHARRAAGRSNGRHGIHGSNGRRASATAPSSGRS
jgi:predicted amidophosphoribosyltransferase